MTRIAVLCSGGGTSLQALIDAQKSGSLGNGEISLVIASRLGIFALERAAANHIPTAIAKRDEDILAQLCGHNIDLVVLAGFLSVIGARVLEAYEDRIINIHPSLIPSFSGQGFYGLRVHKAALERGVKITGATVHIVNHIVDGGRIILQKSVEVLPDDTPESLQRRVMEEAEREILSKAVAMFCRGEV